MNFKNISKFISIALICCHSFYFQQKAFGNEQIESEATDSTYRINIHSVKVLNQHLIRIYVDITDSYGTTQYLKPGELK